MIWTFINTQLLFLDANPWYLLTLIPLVIWIHCRFSRSTRRWQEGENRRHR